ncbi:uncharacterized protein LOC143234291 isoform X2 [Tachypleus tridentatus]|uniref:uncharacterized protein LOC143234291 isoform X2 n=1 Tax=Tachypleus tridentatus TaxID=6853 RepID=UPI003FD566CA
MSTYTTTPGLISTFHSTLDNIVKERLNDTFRVIDECNNKKSKYPHTSSHVARPCFPENDCNQLTMGLIGCLPDNVQQAIKSFSIRPGKQHITFAFPFMEDTIQNFCEGNRISEVGGVPEKPRYITSGFFFDQGLEIIQGFQTYVTLVPYVNRESFPVVLLTLYQRETTEGICRHFQSLIRTMLKRPLPAGLWKISTLVVDLSPKLRELVLNTCAEAVTECQTEGSCHGFSEKPTEELMIQVKSPGIEPVVKEFWRVWGHEQISRQVFPVTVTNVSLAKPLYNAIPGMFRTLPDVSSGSININAFPHVPIKEGLHSVIKCLKTQDISQSKTKSDLVDTKPRSCVCSVCKIPSLASRPSSRLRMYGEFNVKNNHQTSPPQGSAFHLPVHHIMSAEDSQENLPHHSFRFSSTSVFPYSPFTSQRNRFREYLAIKNHASSKSIDFPYGVPTGHIRAAFVEPRASDVSIPTSVVQPIPHYLSLGLKSYEPVMRPYSMINKVEYPVTTGPYQNGFG